MPTSAARIELRVTPDTKVILQQAGALSLVSLRGFPTDTVLARAWALVRDAAGLSFRQPHPIGGWSLALPEGWDAHPAPQPLNPARQPRPPPPAVVRCGR